jgi:hypothetical protein
VQNEKSPQGFFFPAEDALRRGSSFCHSIQLFTAGILGQYPAKTYTEVKQRPRHVIKDELQ